MLVSLVSAHLDAGQDISKDGYTMDFGWAPEKIIANQQTSFVINFVNETTNFPANITSVWTRISLGDNVLFAGEFYPENASVPFEYTFPRDGNYTIDARFENKGEVIEEGSVSFQVSAHILDYNRIIELILAGIIIAFSIALIRKSKRGKRI